MTSNLKSFKLSTKKIISVYLFGGTGDFDQQIEEKSNKRVESHKAIDFGASPKHSMLLCLFIVCCRFQWIRLY